MIRMVSNAWQPTPCLDIDLQEKAFLVPESRVSIDFVHSATLSQIKFET